MSLIFITFTGGGILLLIGLIADFTPSSETNPQDWDIGPSSNPLAFISYLSAFLLFFLGFLGFFCSAPESAPEPRKVELVIPVDAKMNAEIIRQGDKILIKNL